METNQADYFAADRHLRLSRDDKGVLVAEFHNNGGPYIMNALGHTEFVDAFHRIGQDRANKIVIMTGAGDNFIGDVEWSSFGDVTDPDVLSRIHDEGVQTLENIANIRVPVISAIEGRAHIHSDLRPASDRGSSTRYRVLTRSGRIALSVYRGQVRNLWRSRPCAARSLAPKSHGRESKVRAHPSPVPLELCGLSRGSLLSRVTTSPLSLAFSPTLPNRPGL